MSGAGTHYLMSKLEAGTACFFVHYTVDLPGQTEPKNCVAGPYSDAEVLDQRRDIAGYEGVKNAYVSESLKRAPA